MPRTHLLLQLRDVGAKLLDVSREWTPIFTKVFFLLKNVFDARFEPLLLALQLDNVSTGLFGSELLLAFFQLLLVLLFIGVSSI